MEQTVGGVHVPGDSHAYTSHQHNGFHMSTSNAGNAGEDTLPYSLYARLIKNDLFHDKLLIILSVPGFSLTQDLQGGAGCQFSSSPEESVFFQVGSFDRSLSHMSSIYTET